MSIDPMKDQEKKAVNPLAKTPFNSRLSAEGLRILEAISKQTGVSRSGVIEMILREEAKRRNIS